MERDAFPSRSEAPQDNTAARQETYRQWRTLTDHLAELRQRRADGSVASAALLGEIEDALEREIAYRKNMLIALGFDFSDNKDE